MNNHTSPPMIVQSTHEMRAIGTADVAKQGFSVLREGGLGEVSPNRLNDNNVPLSLSMRLVLASASPRRRKLMEQAGIPCEYVSCDIDENLGKMLPPQETVLHLSTLKAKKAADNYPQPVIIIAADTIVYIDGRILNKPESEEEAIEMLKSIAGRKHTVYTGVTLIKKEGLNTTQSVFCETADVFMRQLTEYEIYAYVKTGEPMDKAGSYGIQEKGATLVSRVEGDYFTVVGLPLAQLAIALKEMGYDIMAAWK